MMPTFPSIVTAVTLSLIVSSASTVAGERDRRLSKAAKEAAAERQENIRAEIKAEPKHDWAGAYFKGDGLGMNLSLAIAPKSGYVAEMSGCTGLFNRDYGQVSMQPDRIKLVFTYTKPTEKWGAIPSELVPVPWGERRYLIEPEQIIAFCNAINSGREPRTRVEGAFLLRAGGEEVQVGGQPTLPAKYRDYLLPNPVDATITAVGKPEAHPDFKDAECTRTRVHVNAGENHGLRVGMELMIIEPRQAYGEVELTDVSKTVSEGWVTHYGDERPLDVGWRVSTRSMKTLVDFEF